VLLPPGSSSWRRRGSRCRRRRNEFTPLARDVVVGVVGQCAERSELLIVGRTRPWLVLVRLRQRNLHAAGLCAARANVAQPIVGLLAVALLAADTSDLLLAVQSPDCKVCPHDEVGPKARVRRNETVEVIGR